MRIIQSYWSLPSSYQDKDQYGRYNGGFLSAKYNYMSWALSVLTLKKHYKNVELITDEAGKSLLMDTLQLPYNKVTICLDELNHYHPKLWALGKIKAYQMQKEPFLHIDGDVYIWGKLGDMAFHKKPLIVQNIDYFYESYEKMKLQIVKKFSFIPSEIQHQYQSEQPLIGVNAGVIGGCDIDFFQEYTHKVLSFVDRNIAHLEGLNVGLFNIVFEQQLFAAMAFQQNKHITPYLITQPYSGEFTETMAFHQVPFLTTFIHLMGYAKQNIYACEQVEMRLKYEFPQYHAKIMNLVKAENTALFDENRYKKLKKTFDCLKKSKVDDIMKMPLVLSDHVTINEAETTYTYIAPQTKKSITDKCKQWDTFLQCFAEPTTGNELLELLSEGKRLENDKIHQIKMNIIDFITDKLMYHDILAFA
jgi:hypothetical protein